MAVLEARESGIVSKEMYKHRLPDPFPKIVSVDGVHRHLVELGMPVIIG